MKIDFDLLSDDADPDCDYCEGRGYGVLIVTTIQGGPATISLGKEHIGKAEEVKIDQYEKRICPRCFDPQGRPRNETREAKK